MKETSDVSTTKYYTYILYSLSDQGFYIGFTHDLKARLIKHAKGEVTATQVDPRLEDEGLKISRFEIDYRPQQALLLAPGYMPELFHQ